MKVKALIAGLVAVIIMTAQVGIASAAGNDHFSDVGTERADYNAITFMANMELVGGYPDGTFKPDQEVNRAEALKMIMGMEKMNYWDMAVGDVTSSLAKEMNFTDLDKTAWYYDYLQEAYNNSLVKGYPDGTFKPEQTVNTAEAVKILLNHTFLRIDGSLSEEGSTWYSEYLDYAKAKGITDAAVNPAENITRGKLAQLIYRAYAFDGQTVDKKGVTVALDSAIEKYIVKNEGKEIARLDMFYSMNGEEEAYIKKVTDKYAYVSVCATGFGGYIWYGFCHGDTYEIDLESGSVGTLNFVDVEDNNIRIESFMDAYEDEESPYGALIAWTSNWEKHKIFVTAAGRGYDTKVFMVPEKYTQYGSVKFSPDGKKLAYAAIVGNPQDEESSIFIINLEDGKQTELGGALKSVITVYGWADNDRPLFYHSSTGQQ